MTGPYYTLILLLLYLLCDPSIATQRTSKQINPSMKLKHAFLPLMWYKMKSYFLYLQTNASSALSLKYIFLFVYTSCQSVKQLWHKTWHTNLHRGVRKATYEEKFLQAVRLSIFTCSKWQNTDVRWTDKCPSRIILKILPV